MPTRITSLCVAALVAGLFAQAGARAATGAANAAAPAASSTPAAAGTPPKGAAPTQPGTPQRSKMKACNADAKTKSLHGDERRAFMKQCLSAKPAPLHS